MKEVPDSWWRVCCENMHHPVACVGVDNRFIWVNSAWERLLGYSSTELKPKTWMEITSQEDVGGDLASVKEVLDGITSQYTLSKRYVHKKGHEIPIELSVWRVPMHSGDILCFVVEAIPETASVDLVEDIERKVEKSIQVIRDRLETIEMTKQNSNTSGVNVSVGADNIKWLGAGIIFLIATVGYLIYIAGWPLHNGEAKPPHEIQSEK